MDPSTAPAQEEFARVRHVRQFQRSGIDIVSAARRGVLPADGVNLPVMDRCPQRLGNAHDHQQVAVGQTGERGIERAKDISLGIEMARQRRPLEVDVVRKDRAV